MVHIRPQKLFSLLSEPPSERVVQYAIPFQQGTGGTTMLENMLMISALRTVKARRVFEFGTFFGRTSFNLALNLPDNGELLTLELDDASIGKVHQVGVNASCTLQRAVSKLPMDYYAHASGKKIKRLRGDSTVFDFSPYVGEIDLVFVDGGHEVVTVISDTKNAFAMANTGRPSCVFWHDYGNPTCPGVTTYLEEVEKRGIVHVEDTSVCAWFSDSEMQARLVG